MMNKDNSKILSLLKSVNLNSLNGIFIIAMILLLVFSGIFYQILSVQHQRSLEEINSVVQQKDQVLTYEKQISDGLHNSLNSNLLYKFTGKELNRFQSFYALNNVRDDFTGYFNLISSLTQDEKVNSELLNVKNLINDFDKILSESLNKDGKLLQLIQAIPQQSSSTGFDVAEDSLIQDSIAFQSAAPVAKPKISKAEIDNVDSLVKDMETRLADIDNSLSNITSRVLLSYKDQINSLKVQKRVNTFIVYGIALIILFSVVVWLVYKYLRNSISESKKVLDSIAKGELPEHRIVLKDEFKKISEANNSLITYLNDASQFARKIGDGEFDYEFKPKGKDDALGNSLIEMRERLQTVAKEDKIRNWVNEGQAKFAQVIRIHNDDIKILGDHLISQLVQYLGANQGSIFTLNEEDEQDKYLELLSSYAFNRKKFIDKRIQIGDGLIGQVFKEGKTTYLTEIHEDHFEITTGLGQSKPSCLLIVPLKEDEIIEGIVEIASFNPILDYQIEFVESIGASIASSIRIGKINQQTKILLTESQEKAEEMKAQEEELRQNMEELSATHEQMERRNREMEMMQVKLAEEEYLLNALLHSTHDFIYFKDRESKFIRLSKSLAERFGEKDDKLVIGKSDFDFQGEEHARQAFEDEQRIIATGIPMVDMVEKESWEDGSNTWVSTTKSPLRDEEGKIVGTFGISRDITKSKQVELEVLKQKEWLENFFRHNDQVFVVMDQTGKISYASKGVLDQLGKIKFDGLMFNDIFKDPPLGRFIEHLNIDEGGGQEISMKLTLNNQEKKKIEYRCLASTTESEDGMRNLFIMSK